MKIIILLLLSLNAWALPNSFKLKDLTSENKLIIKKTIDRGYSKKVFFQDGSIVTRGLLQTDRLFCSLGNSRDKKERLLVKEGTQFRFDNHDYVRHNLSTP